MSSSEQTVGAIVSLTPPEEGDNTWTADQVNLARSLPPGDIQGRVDLDWGFGPITGYVDTNTFEIGVSVSILGINVGNIFGNLKDGVGLNINLFLASGSIKFYLKNGNELWVHLDIKVKFDGHFEGDYKIITI
ncbi:hypothetical protein HYQ45_015154 [Verticillium longisporum]|uniref:Uncharacterized protein n=1 Tax=Verticillium longisporum TaxID=100787 RepID=A0A0G4KRM6_VERLO|nr:hypothetical protein HYQ45_015154 [Verticillium longisporum]KAG7119423.1 hypothetical protein HYQ44_005249 [Verticillium longisporum]KAG7126518.1 hypothetical protein HYQ46_010453 [Verticillium longisporum]CRK12120.1 hypothetical protein BN1723_009606 [Verticillium longisporum]CRK14686.1 hypothetical protein BN1708_011211 [Verticillium longisporum]